VRDIRKKGRVKIKLPLYRTGQALRRPGV